MKAYIYVVDNILMFEVLLGYFVETVWSNLLKASRKMPVGLVARLGSFLNSKFRLDSRQKFPS